MNNNTSISLLVNDQLCCYVIRNILNDLDKSELTGVVKLTQYFKCSYKQTNGDSAIDTKNFKCFTMSKLTGVFQPIYNNLNV